MRIDYLSPDILSFRGDSLAAMATAFIDDKRVLLVDALASEYDAIEMRDYLERDLGLRIERIILSHAGQGHQAGLHLFRGAHITLAHELGYMAEQDLAWGRHRLTVLRTPGPLAYALALEANNGELLFAGDRLIGAIAILGEREPEAAALTLAQLQQRGAGKIVAAHIGTQDGSALAHALVYLEKLRDLTAQARAAHPGSGVHAAIAAIAIEDCLADGVHAAALERLWHVDNLKRIAARGLFPASGARHAVTGPATGWMQKLRGSAVVATLTCMLGRLGRSGI